MLAESGNDHPDENCNDKRTDRCGQSRRNSLHADFREDSSKSRCQRGDESINEPRHTFEFAIDYTDYADSNLALRGLIESFFTTGKPRKGIRAPTHKADGIEGSG